MVKKSKRPPEYRVLLHNDDFNRREYVVQVLLKARTHPHLASAFHPLRPPSLADTPIAAAASLDAPRHMMVYGDLDAGVRVV